MNRLETIPALAAPPEENSPALGNQLGMWTLIASEVLFFGGLLVAYAIYRHAYPAAFAAGSARLEFWSGTLNTAVLLTSSLGMAAADVMIKRGRPRAFQVCLLGTALLGLLFLGIKFLEYDHLYRAHLLPGFDYHSAGLPQTQLFLLLYLILTGLHAAHMLIGLGALAWLAWQNHCGRLSRAAHEPVVMVGLYWHFVDCVWVFLYPLLYLIPHQP